MIEILEPNFRFEDGRGSLIQLARDGFSQFNIIFSKADALRGNHFHKINREAFFVISGEFDLTAQRENEIKKLHFSTGDMFLICPYVIHSFVFHTDTLLASMYDIGVELPNGEKDIFIPEKQQYKKH